MTLLQKEPPRAKRRVSPAPAGAQPIGPRSQRPDPGTPAALEKLCRNSQGPGNERRPSVPLSRPPEGEKCGTTASSLGGGCKV